MAKQRVKGERNNVWIELEQPDTDERGDKIAALATNMLQKLATDEQSKVIKFVWSPDKAMFMVGSNMSGYRYLSDNGEWFSLDYLGK